MTTEILEPNDTATAGTFADPTPENRAKSAPPTIHLQKILVPLDFSEMSLKSLQYAIPFARQFGAKLTLLYVIEPLAYVPELPYGVPLPPGPDIAVQRELQDIHKTMIPPEIPVEIMVRENFAAQGVVEAARDLCADLIITTTHGRTGLHHLLMGSTAEKIVRTAPCPVLVLSEREHEFV
jgi:nucleotide-binding universal stress UspA family protein